MAVNPELQYAYSVALHQPMNYKTHYAPYETGRLWLGSAFVAIPGEEQWGYVSAIDLRTGKIAWQVKTEQPMIGGATATAGGLMFTGEGNGWFKAYDARTGKVLWSSTAAPASTPLLRCSRSTESNSSRSLRAGISSSGIRSVTRCSCSDFPRWEGK